jgi:hypothetical protein
MRRNCWTALGIAAVSLLARPAAGAPQPTVCSAKFETAWGHRVTGTADLDGNGKVDAVDLHILMAAWGTNDRPEDINADGVVGCVDLWYLRGNWGACPLVSLDLDGDRVVDHHDQSLLLASFNACTVDANGNGNKELGEPTLDLDNNGLVDDHDVGILFCRWGAAVPGDPDADFDADGRVGEEDLTILLRHTGSKCPGDLDQDGAVGVADIEVLVKGWGS